MPAHRRTKLCKTNEAVFVVEVDFMEGGQRHSEREASSAPPALASGVLSAD